jgi:hypothetical protein
MLGLPKDDWMDIAVSLLKSRNHFREGVVIHRLLWRRLL